jgi:hypothetical protein
MTVGLCIQTSKYTHIPEAYEAGHISNPFQNYAPSPTFLTIYIWTNYIQWNDYDTRLVLDQNA